MKTFVAKITDYTAVISLALLIVGVSSLQAHAQVNEGYTIIRGAQGAQVCIGRWVPPADVALSGTCEGQMMDIAQFAAFSARQSADTLNQMLLVLNAIDQKLAVNNDQIRLLVQAAAHARPSPGPSSSPAPSPTPSINQRGGPAAEHLREMIAERFDALPRRLLANDSFRSELAKLKKDILKQVENLYPAQ